MTIRIYAGSLRPGGGLTVAKIMIEALAENGNEHLVVYTGARDASRALGPVFKKYANVVERTFFPALNVEFRYLLSKLYFLPTTLFRPTALLLSFNYFLPCCCRHMVYHINLLSFQKTDHDSIGKKVKELDAALACRLATLNVFESDYLKSVAQSYTGRPIRNPRRLYIGVDPVFFTGTAARPPLDEKSRARILVVSSVQPHKDNAVCIKTLARLCEIRPDVKWHMEFAGGQSVAQWEDVKRLAENLGVGERVVFRGPLEKQVLSQLMGESLCLMSASRIESFCMVALEAMASGCPVLVTRETSMPESVGDAAVMVDAGAHEQFAEGILGLYRSPEEREQMVRKGFAHVEKFSNAAFKENLRELVGTR